MGKHHKSWSQEEKRTIAQHYQVHGAAKTSKEFYIFFRFTCFVFF